MAIRKLDVFKIILVANVENSWTPPEGLSIVDIQRDLDYDVRLSFVAGGTADNAGDEQGDSYFIINPNWWNAGGRNICLSETHKFFFKCANSNTVRVLGGVE